MVGGGDSLKGDAGDLNGSAAAGGGAIEVAGVEEGTIDDAAGVSGGVGTEQDINARAATTISKSAPVNRLGRQPTLFFLGPPRGPLPRRSLR